MLRRSFICCSVIALLVAGPACAGSIVVKLTFTAGSLAVRSAPASASAAGAVQVPVTLADARGSGKGWTLKVSASEAVSVTSVTVRCAANSTCTLPHAAHGPSGSIVLQAAHDTGMGVMNLVVTVAPLPAGSQPAPLTFTAT